MYKIYVFSYNVHEMLVKLMLTLPTAFLDFRTKKSEGNHCLFCVKFLILTLIHYNSKQIFPYMDVDIIVTLD